MDGWNTKKSFLNMARFLAAIFQSFIRRVKAIASFSFQAWLDLHPLDLQEPTEAFEPEELLSKGPQLDSQ